MSPYRIADKPSNNADRCRCKHPLDQHQLVACAVRCRGCSCRRFVAQTPDPVPPRPPRRWTWIDARIDALFRNLI